MKIGIQGAQGSFHEAAAQKIFGLNTRLVYLRTFYDVFDQVEAGSIDKAVIAIANNAIGFIHEPYSILTSSRAQKLWISDEVYIRVEHQLLGIAGSRLDEIKEIHSQAPALGQCGDYLQKHLPEAKLVEQDDTAKSAELISQWQDTTKAAIASKKAAQLYGLEILAPHIQDDPDNITRFAVIERRPSKITMTHHKFSAILHTPQTPGSLLKALAVFYEAGINLSSLHSAFIPNSAFEMKFFIEFEDTEQLPNHFMEKLGAAGCQLELLGNYEVAEIQLQNLK